MRRIAVGLLVAVTATGCRGGDEKTAPSAPNNPKTFSASGTFTLTSSDLLAVGDQSCVGYNGYDDIEPAAQVVIRDAAGKTLGFASLGEGTFRNRKINCRFHIYVPDIAAGLGVYSVEIANRGEINFKEDDAQRLQLTLGS